MQDRSTWVFENEDVVVCEVTGLRPGAVFNRWTVVEYVGRAKRGYQFRFRCACGKERICEADAIKSGKSLSCRKCSAKIVGETIHKTHGLSRTKVYRTWNAMKTRCYNPKNVKSYRYHGARGIRVADEWLHDFDAFYAHIGEPPTPLHTIDRIDVNGHYEPGNVRWATQYEQSQNTRRAVAKREKRKAAKAVLVMEDGTEIY